MRRWIIVAILLVAIAVAGVVVAAVAWRHVDETGKNTAQNAYWLEVGKTGMQAVGVGVVGAVVAYALRSLERARADRQEYNASRLEFLRLMRRAVSDTKRARRALEALGLTTEVHPRASLRDRATAAAYSAQIGAINEAQLVLLALRDELPSVLQDAPRAGLIWVLLTRMETFLDRLVREHNHKYLSAKRDGSAGIDLINLPELRVFTAKDSDGFRPNFVDPYCEICELLFADGGAPSASAIPCRPSRAANPYPASTARPAS